ncbi:MAG: toll/interleukin-1 receptor domain-containing protein [Anaeroplasmataceae bacterium]|nr:toll/interleukin-1 receptor domain-containing protein [Anaeroplasmataceae bacterium]
MNDIFISYKVHNRKKAIEYYKILKAQNYQVWFDQLVPKGADWKQTIESQIKESTLFLCLLSKECLLDDWVFFQIQTARKYHKKIVYITLDDTLWSCHKEYGVKKESYLSLEEISLEKYFINPKKKKRSILGSMIISSIVLTSLMIWAFVFGIHIMHMSLGFQYGFVFLGIAILLFLSYWNKKIIYFIHSGLAVVLLSITMYVLPSYYLSTIPINSLVFILIYVFTFSLRYSKINLWLSLLAAIFYSLFITIVDASILIFVSQFFDYDCSWLSIIMLFGFMFFKFWNMKSDYE